MNVVIKNIKKNNLQKNFIFDKKYICIEKKILVQK